MQKKLIFKIFSFLFIIIMLLNVTPNTYSQTLEQMDNEEISLYQEDASLYYDNISSIGASITKSGASITCVTSVIAKRSSNITIKQHLQKFDGVAYYDLKVWTDTKTGTSLTAEHSRICSIFDNKYRLMVDVTVGGETVRVFRYLS